MTHPDEHGLPADFRDFDRRLREVRVGGEPLELDRIKQRVLAQASRRSPGRRQKGILMRRPSFLTVALVVGLLLTGTGGALALTGQLPGSGTKDPTASASKHQYPHVCNQLAAENREEERALRRENRAQERRLRRENRAEERRTPRRPKSLRRMVRRQNRQEERQLRRQNRQEERQLRRQNRQEERQCRT